MKSAQDIEPISADTIPMDRDAADARVMEFAERLRSAKRPTQPKPPSGSLDECALRLLDALCKEAPDWAERDAAWAAESGQSPAQRVIKYIGLVLDQQLHMNMLPGYDYLELNQGSVTQNTGGLTPNRAECPQCHKEFNRSIPGQICCSNECGEQFFPKPAPKRVDVPDEFEAHLQAQLNREGPQADMTRGMGVPAPGILR